MTQLTELTLAAALKGLENKDFTSVELTEAHIKAMETARGLNAYIVETPEIAHKQAVASRNTCCLAARRWHRGMGLQP